MSIIYVGNTEYGFYSELYIDSGARLDQIKSHISDKMCEYWHMEKELINISDMALIYNGCDLDEIILGITTYEIEYSIELNAIVGSCDVLLPISQKYRDRRTQVNVALMYSGDPIIGIDRLKLYANDGVRVQDIVDYAMNYSLYKTQQHRCVILIKLNYKPIGCNILLSDLIHDTNYQTQLWDYWNFSIHTSNLGG
jgi:hypothetical protein